MCYPAEFGQTVRALLRRSDWKIWPIASRPSRSLTIIETDTDRCATYDFLLTFHSNQGPISYRARDINGDFSRKSQIFPTPCILRPRWRGFPRNWVPALRSKTRVMGLPGRERSFTISSACWIQYTNVTDWRTPVHSKDRAHIASRGKNQ